MSKRILVPALLVALVAAACSGGANVGTATTSPSPTVPPVETPEAVLLSYQLESGTEYSYEVALDQHLELAVTGDTDLMGSGELPGEAVVDITGTATFTHVVSDGPGPGTYQVRITGDFSDVTVSGTVDGEPVDEVPDFVPLEPIDVTIVVDEKGNPVGGGDGLDDPFAGLLGDVGPLGAGGLAPGIDPGRFVGPPLSDEEVTVGDSWSEETETPGFGTDPIVTRTTSTVTGVEELDGVEVFVIDTTTTTDPVEIDLAAFFAGFFGALLPEDATEEERAEVEGLVDQLEFLIGLRDAAAEARTWFDVEAGLSRRSETTAGAVIAMDMTMPDEETGELVSFSMEMVIDQRLDYRLLTAPQA